MSMGIPKTMAEVEAHNARVAAGKKTPGAPGSIIFKDLYAYGRYNFQTDTGLPDAEQCERPQALAAGGEGKTPRPGLRHCRFTLRRLKLLDVDAKYASVKDLLDCLTRAGIIRGDREGEITLEVVQEKVVKAAEETVIEVFE